MRGRASVTCLAALAAAAPAEAAHEAWQPRSDSRLARTEVASAVVAGSLYVIGGYTTTGAPTAAVERYDTRTDTWRLVTPMPAALNHASAVGYRGDLYVVGGYTGLPFSLGIGTGGIADSSSRFWRYEPERDRWTSLPPAPSRRAAGAVAVIGHELFFAAGADARRPLRRLEVFDFRSGRWSSGPPNPLATEHTAGAALGRFFYVVGGRPFYGGGVNRFVQRYDSERERWDQVADLNRGRAGFVVAASCGGLVAFGGEDPAAGFPGTIPEVERYDPKTNRWQLLPAMRTPRHGLAGGAVSSSVYAAEGGPVTLLSVSVTNERLMAPCPSSDRTPPKLRVRVLTRSLNRARRSGRIRVRIVSSERVKLRTRLFARGGQIGFRRARLQAGRARTLRVRLGRPGRRLVRQAERLRVTARVRARDEAGNLARGKARRALR